MVKKRKDEYIFGLRAIIEAIYAGKPIEKILLRKDKHGDLTGKLYKLISGQNIPFQFVPIEKLNQITQKNHQGAIAMVSPIEYVNIEQVIPKIYEEGEAPFLLMPDGITDVRNLGAICRTAESTGVHGIVLPTKGTAQINADAVKTSAGALNYLQVSRTAKPVDTLKFLKTSGLKIIGASEKSKQSYVKASYQDPLILVMGAEDTGISPHVLRMCDEVVSIPVFGKVGSLNVSVATAVLLYEVIRQRLATTI